MRINWTNNEYSSYKRLVLGYIGGRVNMARRSRASESDPFVTRSGRGIETHSENVTAVNRSTISYRAVN